MAGVMRFGVSLPEQLLKKFDQYIKKEKYSCRSEAVRDLIRSELVKQEWTAPRGEIAGTITYVYDHHVRGLLNKITDLQHNHQNLIVSTQHVHIDHNNCLEIIIFKGEQTAARRLYNALRALKHIKHTAITMSSTGRDLS